MFHFWCSVCPLSLTFPHGFRYPGVSASLPDAIVTGNAVSGPDITPHGSMGDVLSLHCPS
ncbi:hypothetical protein [Aeromonas schubertii]|uniref:hypothetical protein n=1 Tax=Aeromonas TaxID=642 RepID=UPI0010A790F7|nr:hypothetical protein [Aeromonas schubertii]QCG49815.1 hypothetical protein E2P79_20140 [Aeromonas schubertii]